jgi:tetratricopeptide (TPR) repeat protein
VRDRAAQKEEQARDLAARKEEQARDLAARQAKAADNLDAALERAEWFQGQRRRAAALAALERAELLAGEASPDLAQKARLLAIKERLKAEARDQEFMAQFEGIRLDEASRVDVKESHFSERLIVPEIWEALHRYGIDIGVTAPAEAAARVQSRPEHVRRQLIAAFDECLTWAGRDDPTRQWLVAALAAADNDAWRTRARTAFGSAALRLAREVDLQKQPPSFLIAFAVRLPTRATLHRPIINAQGRTERWVAEEKAYGERLEVFRRIQEAYPADLWANVRLAQELTVNGRSAEAVRYLTAVLALRPKNPGIHLNLGAALKVAGEVDAAIAAYRQAVALAPEYRVARIFLGASLLEDKKQPDEAIQEFRMVLARYPDDALAHYCLGNALREKNQLDDTIREYRRTIALDSQHVGAHFNLGNALAEKNQLDEAIREYRRTIALNSQHVGAHVGLGAVLYRQTHWDEAIEEWRKAIALDPKSIHAHKNLALALRDRRPRCDGLWLVGTVTALDPRFALAPQSLSIALQRRKHLDESIEEFRKVAALDPNNVNAHHELGNLLDARGSLEEAGAEYREAIRIKKDFFRTQWNLVYAYGSDGQWDKAAAACAEALELAPGDPGWWGLGAELRLYMGDLPGYRRACRELLARLGVTAADHAARTARTCLLASDALPDLQAVFKLADVTIEKNGLERWNLLTKALAEYRAGRFSTAIDWLRRVDPKADGESLDATAFALLAMARKRQGQADQARAALSQAQAILAPQLPGPERSQHFGKYWESWLHCQILYREAESLLGRRDKGR